MTLPVIQTVEKRAYSVEEISAQTTLSKAFLRKEIKEKRLKVQRFGRRVLILSEDLEAYLCREQDEQL